MAKAQKSGIIGGKNFAHENPLGLVKKWKAVCIRENIVLSPEWRYSKAEAREDAIEHIEMGHKIDFDVKISKK